MAPRVSEACSHVLQAIAEIDGYVLGLSNDQVLADQMRMRAIERCVEIISEAVRHIPDDARKRHSEIPWRDIEAIGNIMRHGYFHVNADIVLKVARFELEALASAVRDISPLNLDGGGG